MKLSLLGSSAVSRFHITDKAAVPLSTLQSAEEGVIDLTISESNKTVEEKSVVEHNAKANQIAYVISITSCRANSTNVLDGAAILGHSIHLASRNSSYVYARKKIRL